LGASGSSLAFPLQPDASWSFTRCTGACKHIQLRSGIHSKSTHHRSRKHVPGIKTHNDHQLHEQPGKTMQGKQDVGSTMGFFVPLLFFVSGEPWRLCYMKDPDPVSSAFGHSIRISHGPRVGCPPSRCSPGVSWAATLMAPRRLAVSRRLLRPRLHTV
jgi:hypothetical protein